MHLLTLFHTEQIFSIPPSIPQTMLNCMRLISKNVYNLGKPQQPPTIVPVQMEVACPNTKPPSVYVWGKTMINFGIFTCSRRLHHVFTMFPFKKPFNAPPFTNYVPQTVAPTYEKYDSESAIKAIKERQHPSLLIPQQEKKVVTRYVYNNGKNNDNKKNRSDKLKVED